MANGDVITNAGVAIMSNRMLAGGTEPKFIGWGTGTTTPVVADTALQTEVVDTARATGTSSRVTTTVANDTYQVVGTITATTTRAITEAGLFDAITVGGMLTHSVFSVINLVLGDSIAFTFKIKFVAG